MAGETRWHLRLVVIPDVSIRSRHRWREKRTFSGNISATTTFQSAPAIDGGRNFSVNTHDGVSVFQSAPAIDGGRNNSPAPIAASSPCFNPLPPSMAGETRCVEHPGSRIAVSIRSRHRWREKRLGDQSPNGLKLFQSAPAIDGGRNLSGLPSGWTTSVSIRSRHRWREKPTTRLPAHPKRCFNPLPPSMAGETFAPPLLARMKKVSIRSRHRWREKRGRRIGFHEFHGVSIRSRHRWREKQGIGILVVDSERFNPLPPSMAGETAARIGITHT